MRFVAVSSFGHTLAPAPQGIEFEKLKMPDAGTKWHRYGQSKLAGILLAKGMAKRQPEILSVSVHPGLVSTELGSGMLKNTSIKHLMAQKHAEKYSRRWLDGLVNRSWGRKKPTLWMLRSVI